MGESQNILNSINYMHLDFCDHFLIPIKKSKNNFLSHRITDSFKNKENIRFKWVLIAPRGRKLGVTKLVLMLWFLFQYTWKIICNTMPYMIFQYGWELVIIQWILIGFKARLENYFFCSKLSVIKHCKVLMKITTELNEFFILGMLQGWFLAILLQELGLIVVLSYFLLILIPLNAQVILYFKPIIQGI